MAVSDTLMREGVQHSRPGLLVSFSMASFSTSIPGRREVRLPLPAPARWLLVLGAPQVAAPYVGLARYFSGIPQLPQGQQHLPMALGTGRLPMYSASYFWIDCLTASRISTAKKGGLDGIPAPPKNSQGPPQGPQGCIKPGHDVLSAGHPMALLIFMLGAAPWARGEQHSPAVRWQGHGSCSQALCPRGGTLQRQVVSGDGFQRDGVWQPAARYCSLGHDLQETECTGCRTLRGSLMATVDTQTPSLWRVSRALRGETEAHIGRGRAPVPPLTPETTLKHPPVSTRAMRGLCPPMPAGPISPPWSTFCAGPWRCPWQERCSGRRDT